MIRVYLIPNDGFPEIVIKTLKASGDIHFSEEPALADVQLLYVTTLNVKTFSPLIAITKKYSSPSIVLYEQADGPFLRDSVFQKSVAGAIRCDSSLLQILAALQAAVAGLKVFSDINANHRFPISEAPSLTPREFAILRLIADGEGNKSIAYLLEISEHTVKFHISSIFEKLHVSSRTEAIKIGIQRGLISI